MSGLPPVPYSVVLMQVTPGVVSPVYSDREFDHVLKKHADQLVVVCASSTDCKPCRSFEPVFDVGAFVSFHIYPPLHSGDLSDYGLHDLAWGSYLADTLCCAMQLSKLCPTLESQLSQMCSTTW